MRPQPQSEPRFWFALAAEDREHHEAVTRLTDRVLEESVGGFRPETREATRRWREATPLDAYWRVSSAVTLARALGLPLRGHFAGDRELEAVTFRAQLLLWTHAHESGRAIHVGFIVRDTDKKARKDGAQSAVQSRRWPFEVVLAFPHPEVEAWPIAVFEPATKDERKLIEKLTRRLGFSPTAEPHRLTSTVRGAVTDVKAVHEELFEGDAARAEAWLEADLEPRGGPPRWRSSV